MVWSAQALSPLSPKPPITLPLLLYKATPPPKVMMPPGTEPIPEPCGRNSGLNGLELFSPYSEPPGWVAAYRLAVDKASLSLLKSLAVLALAMAMALLPGQASPILMTEHKTPLRSTTADHIRLGLKMPPLVCATTTASSLCTLFTTLEAKLHCP